MLRTAKHNSLWPIVSGNDSHNAKEVNKNNFLMALVLLCSTFSFAQVGTHQIGWTIFHDTTIFSNSFIIELESQLKEQFEKTIECPGAVDEFGFFMNVNQPDSSILERNGYSFMEVNIYDLRSFSKRVTICWKSDSIPNLASVHISEVNSRTIQFAWTSDFPTEEYKSVIIPQIKKTKGEEGLAFDLNIYLYTIPDVYLKYVFVSPPDEQTLQSINAEFKKMNKRKHKFYFSELTNFEGSYSMTMDFDSIDYDNFDRSEIQIYVESLIDIHKKLSKSKVGNKIKSVTLI